MPGGARRRPAARAAGGSTRRRRAVRALTPTVIKLGGELLETATRLRSLARVLADVASREPLVVVHGGGREVDAEMARLGIAKQAVDGLRITNGATLDVVAGVLAGRVNTRLVAALATAGARPVGLTGADAGIAPVRRERRYRTADGRLVDLGYVGRPVGQGEPVLLIDLLAADYTPVVASLSAAAAGQVLNVNADTLAGDLAARLAARRLLIAGSTAGVLDEDGRTIRALDDTGIDALIDAGGASAGMVAKLLAGRAALAGGAHEVAIVDARRPRRGMFERAAGTTLTGETTT